MITVGDCINKILDLFYRGVPETSSRRRPSIIYSHIRDIRASLIKEKIDKKEKLSDELISTFRIDLEPYLGNLYRSTEPLPDLVKYIYAGTIDGIDPYFKYDKSTYFYAFAGTNYKGKKAFYIEDDYFYTECPDNNKLQFRAIVQDPLQINQGDCLLYPEYNFYIDGNMSETLYNIYQSKYAPLQLQVPNDLTQNEVAENG